METENLNLRVPPGLRDALKADAAASMRSLNQHAAYLLTEALKRRERDSKIAEQHAETKASA
ncbi:toxin-antitoxin system HicB family antitoxin [Bradyrhizobium sp. ORS 86]|uniref:toxin-antitoxin system HicB family antitoxin n=1 Tax=Bradyrhizobium sp. ORS 86 TaxID=1685970 RepID=UPI00388DFB0E